MEPTIFHKFATGEVKPTTKVYFEDEDTLAFASNAPTAPVHIVIISKKVDMASIAEMKEEQIPEVGRLVYVAKQIAEELGIAESGYKLGINVGAGGGQTVFYLHLHLVAGKQIDREVL